MTTFGLHQRTRQRLRPRDAHLAATVKVRLIDLARLSLQDITVEANSGVVLLEGCIANEGRKALASSVAASVPGVRGVFNRLLVADRHDDQA